MLTRGVAITKARFTTTVDASPHSKKRGSSRDTSLDRGLGTSPRSRAARNLALTALAWLLPHAALAQAPSRVVSINLCTDQLLMALAEPGQITAVSRWARRPDMSFLAAKAQSIPVMRGSAEEVLRLRPDLVLAGTFSGTATRALLVQQGIRVEAFAPPRNLDEAKVEIERAEPTAAM